MWDIIVSIYFYSFLFSFLFLFVAILYDYHRGEVTSGIVEMIIFNLFLSIIPIINSAFLIVSIYALFKLIVKYVHRQIIFRRNPRYHFCYNFSKVLDFYRTHFLFQVTPSHAGLDAYHERQVNASDLLYHLENAPSNAKIDALLNEYASTLKDIIKLQKQLEKKRDEHLATQFTSVFKDTIDLFSLELEYTLFNR